MGRSGAENIGLRVSKAGYDALNPGLDGLLFDSDLIPAKAFIENFFTTNVNNNSGRTAPQAPAVTNAPHGLSGTFIIVAIAKPLVNFDNSTPTAFTGWGTGINGTLVGNVYLGLSGTNYVTPHYFHSRNVNTGAISEGGYTVSFDATNINVYNYCAHTLRVKWKALRVGA